MNICFKKKKKKKSINSNHLFSRIHEKQNDFLNNLVPNSFPYTNYWLQKSFFVKLKLFSIFSFIKGGSGAALSWSRDFYTFFSSYF